MIKKKLGALDCTGRMEERKDGISFVLTSLVALVVSGCVPDVKVVEQQDAGTGGKTSTATGGTTGGTTAGKSGTGGAVAVGGGTTSPSSTGGSNAPGGSSSTGGSSGTVTSVTGGVAPGGSSSTGGSSGTVTSVTGGVATGGSSSTGSSSATVTTATGGSANTGGSAALVTGGSSAIVTLTATGATAATGGSKSTGGAAATGGSKSTGGTAATGGLPTTGGAGSGGTANTGGWVATGGAPVTGGTSSASTGGTSAITWSEVNIGLVSTNKVGRVAVGNARGDGTNRVYVGEGSLSGLSGGIYEFGYSGNSWIKTYVNSNTSSSLSTIAGLKIGSVRNDGSVGIYASGYGFAEYRYTNSAWSGAIINFGTTVSIQWNYGLSLGDGRNDGTPRVYIGDYNKAIDIAYNLGAWTAAIVDTGSQETNSTVVAQGQNDGSNHLYAVLGTFGGPVWEYAWSSTAGSYQPLQNISQAISGRFFVLCAGAGRNDNIQRIYAWGDPGLYEFSYSGGDWSSVQVSAIAFDSPDNAGVASLGDVLLANGRGDGALRLYTADQSGVGEYTFSDVWQKTGQVTSNAARGLDVGLGRNDGVKRLYVTENYNLYEYTAQN